MRRTILFSLCVLLAASAAYDASAQRHGGGGHGFVRGGYRVSRGRAFSPYGFSNGYLDYDSGDAYAYAPQPGYYLQPPVQPVVFLQPPTRPATQPDHPVVTEYTWPAATAKSSTPASEPQFFAIVRKDGATLSAVTVFASDDGLHYVDPDERHMRISMSEIDRAATLKLNRARNLNLYLPAQQ